MIFCGGGRTAHPNGSCVPLPPPPPPCSRPAPIDRSQEASQIRPSLWNSSGQGANADHAFGQVAGGVVIAPAVAPCMASRGLRLLATPGTWRASPAHAAPAIALGCRSNSCGGIRHRCACLWGAGTSVPDPPFGRYIRARAPGSCACPFPCVFCEFSAPGTDVPGFLCAGTDVLDSRSGFRSASELVACDSIQGG